MELEPLIDPSLLPSSSSISPVSKELPSRMAAEESQKSIQFDIVLLISCHGLTLANSFQTNSDGTISLKRIEFPSNMKDTKLTIMTASEIGVTTCDYLTLFKERLLRQIGDNIEHEQFIDLNQVQKYFRTLKKMNLKKL